MTDVIKYDNLHLYTRYASIDSATLRKYLTDNNIAYVELTYSIDAAPDALVPLNTWFEDSNGTRVEFADMPVLVYDKVFWEAPDHSDRYSKRWYAQASTDLPIDFIEKSIKNS